MAALIVAGTLLAGCAGEDAGAIARYRVAEPDAVPLERAPADARYGLFTPSDATPVAVFPLKKGDRLGFVRRDGRVFAVAGTNELPCEVDPTRPRYAWRRVER